MSTVSRSNYSDMQILPNTRDMLQRLYNQGRTLEEIGNFFGVSRQRINKLIDTSTGGAKFKNGERAKRRGFFK